MNIHLCIVTGQPLANLIPILQEQPQLIALVVSAPMVKASNTFAYTLKHCGWQAEQIVRFNNVPDHDYEAILERAMEIADKLAEAYPHGKITLNATGGNKLMTLAFTSAFNDKTRHRAIYTDTFHNRLEVLHPPAQPLAIEPVLSLETYLKAEGKTLRAMADNDTAWRQRAERRKKATKHLGNHSKELNGLFGQFNQRWGKDEDRRQPPPLMLNSAPRGPWRNAITELADAEVIDWTEATQTLTPMNPQAAGFLSGGWLEEFVWWAAKDAGAQEVHCSVEFTDDFDRKADLRNEIDVAVLHNNRLLLVECKTGNVTQDGKDTDIVYKLDSLLDQAAGALGEGLLVSAQPLAHQNSRGRSVNTRSRARSVNLHTAEVDELKRLGSSLAIWIESGKWPEQA